MPTNNKAQADKLHQLQVNKAAMDMLGDLLRRIRSGDIDVSRVECSRNFERRGEDSCLPINEWKMGIEYHLNYRDEE
jgi:hypothetical protein